MKKLIMALVCLMTMVMLTSCSSDDEDITEQYSTAILGGWKCEENNNGAEFWFGQDGTAYLLYFDNGVYDYGIIANYSITGNHLSLINISNDSSDITYWNNKIDEVEKELSTARGDRRQHLIDQLNEYIKELQKAKSKAQKAKKTIQFTIISITKNELTLERADKQGGSTFKRIK